MRSIQILSLAFFVLKISAFAWAQDFTASYTVTRLPPPEQNKCDPDRRKAIKRNTSNTIKSWRAKKGDGYLVDRKIEQIQCNPNGGIVTLKKPGRTLTFEGKDKCEFFHKSVIGSEVEPYPTYPSTSFAANISGNGYFEVNEKDEIKRWVYICEPAKGEEDKVAGGSVDAHKVSLGPKGTSGVTKK